MATEADRNRTVLPTILSLRAFETVARLGSISSAAEALYLTQSAVSKQVLALETMLAAELFTRSNRGLTLTDQGHAYLPFARTTIETLSEGARTLERPQNSQTPLRLHVVPVVGERWLMPRFKGFRKAHPKIAVEFPFFITNSNDGDPDATIKFGDGNWPERTADYLFGREVLLVASPALAPAFESPERLAAMEPTFLEHHAAGIGWNEARDALGLAADCSTKTMSFGFYALIIRAAVAGEGAALLPRFLIQDEIMSDALVRIGELELKSPHGYWLTRSKARAMRPEFRVLRAWLIEQARTANKALE